MTTLVVREETRSMAPPMPFTILPGIIQLARSPYRDTCSRDYWSILEYPESILTCMAPSMVISMWPLLNGEGMSIELYQREGADPLIMANDSSLEKKEPPPRTVTVSSHHHQSPTERERERAHQH